VLIEKGDARRLKIIGRYFIVKRGWLGAYYIPGALRYGLHETYEGLVKEIIKQASRLG
jgi:hypothetical protein